MSSSEMNFNYFRNLLKTLKNKEITNEDEKKVVLYFIKNISVGEILALRELEILGVKNPIKIIRSLILKGVLEKGEGCYNLAKDIREELFKLKHKGIIRI